MLNSENLGGENFILAFESASLEGESLENLDSGDSKDLGLLALPNPELRLLLRENPLPYPELRLLFKEFSNSKFDFVKIVLNS